MERQKNARSERIFPVFGCSGLFRSAALLTTHRQDGDAAKESRVLENARPHRPMATLSLPVAVQVPKE